MKRREKMKLSDIEQNIKKEGGEIKVPDVLNKVKRAPINKLLSDKTPAQAFKKRTATLILILTLLILAVLSISLFAMLNKPASKSAAKNNAQYSLSAQNDAEFTITRR